MQVPTYIGDAIGNIRLVVSSGKVCFAPGDCRSFFGSAVGRQTDSRGEESQQTDSRDEESQWISRFLGSPNAMEM